MKRTLKAMWADKELLMDAMPLMSLGLLVLALVIFDYASESVRVDPEPCTYKALTHEEADVLFELPHPDLTLIYDGQSRQWMLTDCPVGGIPQ